MIFSVYVYEYYKCDATVPKKYTKRWHFRITEKDDIYSKKWYFC